MKKMIKFKDIGQFRNTIKTILHENSYVGLDDSDNPIYNNALEKPKVIFKGTVKIHGSNGSVGYNDECGLWAQSRSNIITIEKDNAGCAFFVDKHKDAFMELINKVKDRENIDTTKNTINIYFEWCGGNIQKGVSISGLDKMAIVFAVKITPVDDEIPSYYIDSFGLSKNEDNIYNVDQFPTYELEIDFDRPDLAQNEMVKLVEEVEKECPVGKFFGRKLDEDNTTGEGIVWVGYFKGNRHTFKTKGEKHSTSNVKTIAEVDVTKMDNIRQFVDYAVTENRLNQAIEQVFTTNDIEVDIKKTGDFIRWMVNDITKEETDVLIENNLEPKEVNKFISQKSRGWFLNYINSGVGIS